MFRHHPRTALAALLVSGLALAGTILGYVGMAIMVVVVIAYIALVAWAAQEGWTEGSISA